MTDREFGLTTTPLPAIRSSEKLIQTTDKEWVGLTDETYWEMWVESPSDVLRFAHAIEAKLKENNYD
jgi:hypothetical protein